MPPIIVLIPSSRRSSDPPLCKIARISELNSWPLGIPENMIPLGAPEVFNIKLIGLLSKPCVSCSSKLNLSETSAIPVKKSTNSGLFECTPD